MGAGDVTIAGKDAGACSRDGHRFFMAMDGRYAGPPVLPAPADTSHIPVGRKCRSSFRAPWMVRMPKLQEQISASDGHGWPVCRSAGVPDASEHFPHPCGSEMQEQISASDGHGWPVCRSAGAPGTCGHFPHPYGSEMQEHFPVMAAIAQSLRCEQTGPGLVRHGYPFQALTLDEIDRE
jgi:hypothetical protein